MATRGDAMRRRFRPGLDEMEGRALLTVPLPIGEGIAVAYSPTPVMPPEPPPALPPIELYPAPDPADVDRYLRILEEAARANMLYSPSFVVLPEPEPAPSWYEQVMRAMDEMLRTATEAGVPLFHP